MAGFLGFSGLTSRPASMSGRRSSGRGSGWCSAAGIITGSTSRPGMQCAAAAPAIGRATGSRRRCGRSRAGTRTPGRSTARRSPWRACVVRSRTKAALARPFTSRSAARAPPSSAPRCRGLPATRSSCRRPMSMLPCCARGPSPAIGRCWSRQARAVVAAQRGEEASHAGLALRAHGGAAPRRPRNGGCRCAAGGHGELP